MLRAKQIWVEGFALARQLRSEDDISYYLGSLAVIDGKHGLWEEADKGWSKGLEIAERTGFRERICTHLQNIGWGLLARGAAAEAIAHLDRALKLGRAVGLLAHVSFTLANLGLVFAQLGEPRQAQLSSEESLEIANQIRRIWLTSAVLVTNADQQLVFGRAEAAEPLYRKALSIAESAGHEEHVALARFGLGRIAELTGEAHEATELLNSALQYFEREKHYMASKVIEQLSRNSSNR